MGVVWAVKESPKLVLKWEKLIKTVLSREMGPRRMGKAHQSPFTQELGGRARLVVTAHSYAVGTGTRPLLPSASPGDPLWAGPEQQWCKRGGRQSKSAQPPREADEKFRELCVAFGTKWCRHITVKGLNFPPLRDRLCSQFCYFLKRKLAHK